MYLGTCMVSIISMWLIHVWYYNKQIESTYTIISANLLISWSIACTWVLQSFLNSTFHSVNTVWMNWGVYSEINIYFCNLSTSIFLQISHVHKTLPELYCYQYLSHFDVFCAIAVFDWLNFYLQHNIKIS